MASEPDFPTPRDIERLLRRPAAVQQLVTVDALRERERRLREVLADADSWLIGVSRSYKDSTLHREIAELLATKERELES